jgi:hypothetical protein
MLLNTNCVFIYDAAEIVAITMIEAINLIAAN